MRIANALIPFSIKYWRDIKTVYVNVIKKGRLNHQNKGDEEQYRKSRKE